MKNLLPKQAPNSTKKGISWRDALAAISGNIHLMVVPIIIALTICGLSLLFLFLPRSSANLCQPSDRAYQLLLSRHEEWQSYFSQFPPDSQSLLRVENYIVSQLGRSINNQAVLAIYSAQGYSSGVWGQAGYVYTSGESFVFPDSRYRSQLLTPHIYCYERLSR